MATPPAGPREYNEEVSVLQGGAQKNPQFRMGGGGAQKKPQKPARKKTPIFGVDGFPGAEKGAAGRHGGSARKKKPKNRRVKKTPKTGAQKNPQNPFWLCFVNNGEIGGFFARHPVLGVFLRATLYSNAYWTE